MSKKIHKETKDSGQDELLFEYDTFSREFDDNITGSPNARSFQLNNADYTLVTSLDINESGINSQDESVILDTIAVDDIIRVTAFDAPTRSITLKATGPSVGGNIPVTYQSDGGETPFTDGDDFGITIFRSSSVKQPEEDLTTSYAFTDADHGKIIELNNAAAIALTLNTGLRSDFACTYVQKGAGQITISGTATLNNADGFLVTEKQHVAISIIPSTTADNYTIAGRLVP